MLAYVEVLTLSPHTMMALAATGTPITNTHSLAGLQLTPANTEVSVDLNLFNCNALILTAPACGTVHNIATCIQNSMHVDDAPSNHHDQ